MRRWLKWVVSLGVDGAPSEFDAQRIRMMNVGVLLGLGLTLLTIPVDLAMGGVGSIPGTLSLILVALWVFRFQASRRPFAAALTLSVLAMAAVTAQFLYLGPIYGVHYWLLGLILCPYLFFPRRSRVAPNVLGTLSTALFCVVTVWIGEQEDTGVGVAVSQILVALLLLGLSMTLRRLLLSVEERTEEQQQSIAAARQVIEQFPEQNPNPVLRLSASGELMYTNPAARALTERLGLGLGDTFPIDLPSNLADGEVTQHVEMAFDEQTMLFKISPVVDLGFFILYGTDVSALKELEENRKAVANALERERDVSRLKEEFLASLSHELRTPLNAILGLAEALQEQVYGPLTEMQLRSLRTIWESGQRQLTMVDDLLSYARIGAARYPTQIIPADIGGCVRRAALSMAEAARSAELELRVEASDALGLMPVDARHLERILRILLENAVKFTPAGGEVGVALRLSDDDSEVEIRVWDTGIGITPEKQAHLFEPFVQIEGGLSRRYGGTGLGLALTSRLASLLSATLNVESEVGEGTCFILTLPRTFRPRYVFYGSLLCPSCFVLTEWLHELHMAHFIHWDVSECALDLAPEGAPHGPSPERLAQMFERISRLAPGTEFSQPERWPSARRALATLKRISDREPWRAAEAWRAVYRAVWSAGLDIDDWDVLRTVLLDFGLGELNDDIPEMSFDYRAPELKRDGPLPALVAEGSGALLRDLRPLAEVINFLNEDFVVATAPS